MIEGTEFPTGMIIIWFPNSNISSFDFVYIFLQMVINTFSQPIKEWKTISTSYMILDMQLTT